MATVIRLELARDDEMETYYEPAYTPALEDALTALRERGWQVTVQRVDADRELAELRARADAAYQQAAALKGASSAWLTYAVEAQYYEQLAEAAEAAAQGKGSLLDGDPAMS